jgi:hypothetical protein
MSALASSSTINPIFVTNYSVEYYRTVILFKKNYTRDFATPGA